MLKNVASERAVWMVVHLIGLAFAALAVRTFVIRGSTWDVWLRVLVAVGFALLGIVELRAGGRSRQR
jgi:hypothetical protein